MRPSGRLDAAAAVDRNAAHRVGNPGANRDPKERRFSIEAGATAAGEREGDSAASLPLRMASLYIGNGFAQSPPRLARHGGETLDRVGTVQGAAGEQKLWIGGICAARPEFSRIDASQMTAAQSGSSSRAKSLVIEIRQALVEQASHDL